MPGSVKGSIELARRIIEEPERWTIYELELARCIVALTTPPSDTDLLAHVLANKAMNDD